MYFEQLDHFWVLILGRNNIVSGVAKAIMVHFKKHPLAIVNVKGRAKGTSVQEVVFKLEVCIPEALFFVFKYRLTRLADSSSLSLSLSLLYPHSKQQVQFLSLKSLAKSYFTGVGGWEIYLGTPKRRMSLMVGNRVELGQLSLLNSWQQSEWNVGCRVM